MIRLDAVSVPSSMCPNFAVFIAQPTSSLLLLSSISTRSCPAVGSSSTGLLISVVGMIGLAATLEDRDWEPAAGRGA